MSKKTIYLGIVAMLISISSNIVHAQFAGDVFFQEPSIVIPQGESGVLSVQSFAGALPIGAIQIDINFDSTTLDIRGIQASSEFDEEGELVSQKQDNLISLVLVNSSSNSEPIGVVDLFSFEVVPTAAATINSISTISIDRTQYLYADFTTETSGIGLSAEVIVGATQLAARSAVLTKTIPPSQPMVLSEGDTLFDRGSKLRRRGVTFPMQTQGFQGHETSWVTLEPEQSVQRE